MIGENINIPAKPLRVLVSPLHWGLGHATRIIPVIKVLQEQGVEVFIAANDAPAALLQAEFPAIKILASPRINITYPTKSKWFFFKMLVQAPSVLSAIMEEKKWLKKTVAENRIHAVISDNRFGLVSKDLPCVFITHQLFINAPKGFLRWLAQKINYFYINQFSECWVPDWEMGKTLAGKLSHPEKMPAIPVHYMGPLSRLDKGEQAHKHILVVLSGPEPQRSLWEKQLLKQIKALPQKFVLVRGLPNEKEPLAEARDLIQYQHVNAHLMSALINESSIVIARCGYSTVMDLVALRKKALLVPTPGQGEQEYLADHLKLNGIFYTCKQEDLDLRTDLQKADEFAFDIPGTNAGIQNQQIIIDWLNRLREQPA